MERQGAGLATQSNAFDKLKSIILDAHRLGLYDENPLEGVKPPQYDPKRAVIPSPEKLQEIRTAGDDDFLLITDLMSGCGMRNGEAAAVNLNNIVADDVYRITEQVNQTTKKYGRLKHRRVGEYRDTPCLPARRNRSSAMRKSMGQALMGTSCITRVMLEKHIQPGVSPISGPGLKLQEMSRSPKGWSFTASGTTSPRTAWATESRSLM